MFLTLAASGLGISGMQPAPVVWRHTLFAVGIMPLILGAIVYFTPVLTRTAPVASGVLLLPAVVAVLGVTTVIALAWWPVAVPWIAGVLLILVVLEILWIWLRRNQAVGGVHPGIYWYLAALMALLLALVVVAMRPVVWDVWPMMRRFHLHLNLFGFLGMTAIGTLRVLLPTVLAMPDAAAAAYLRVYMPYVVFATLCIAVGAAIWPPLSWLGSVVLLMPAAGLVKSIRQNVVRDLGMHHAALALSAATLGWLSIVVAGLMHGIGLVRADALMWLLVFLFLLPLVTGASSYLLPLWRWPGPMTAAHTRMRAQLMRWTGVRVLAFYLSAGFALLNIEGAHIPAVIALLGYSAQVGYAFLSQGRDDAPGL